MADLLAVADTHALLFHVLGGSHLGKKAAALFDACERGDATIYLPAPAMWEICQLARVGRVNLRRKPAEFFDDLFSNPAYQPLDLTPAHVLDADTLTFTRDPFDALICASARELSLPLITRDAAIAGSGAVKVLW